MSRAWPDSSTIILNFTVDGSVQRRLMVDPEANGAVPFAFCA